MSVAGHKDVGFICNIRSSFHVLIDWGHLKGKGSRLVLSEMPGNAF